MPRTLSISLPELKMCKHCDKIATGYDGTCVGHSPRRNLGRYSASPTPRATVKNPMGVELECYNPDGVIHNVTHVAQYVCEDGSLPSGGGEIKLCAPESKMEDQAADVAQRAAIAGNRVDKSCGFHLHLKRPDMGRYYEGYGRLKIFVQAVEPFIFSIVPKSRRGNRFCQSIDDSTLDSHHSWFSLSSRHPTYEVRIHSGTINAWKVKGWINAWKQVRPDIDRVINGVDGWSDIVSSYRDDGFLKKLTPNSIGFRYINARLKANGSLKDFGFSTK